MRTRLVLTGNLPSGDWDGVFGDHAVAAAMIDRIVHHAVVLTLQGGSYGSTTEASTPLPSIKAQAEAHQRDHTVGSASDSTVAHTDDGALVAEASWTATHNRHSTG